MGTAHCTVTLAHKNGLARDSVVNTFTFGTAGDFVNPADADAIAAAITDFYNGVHAPATRSIASFLGVSLSRTVNPVLRVYDVGADLAGTPAGSPLFTRVLVNLGVNTSASGLPAEVAICLTAAADFGVDVEFAPGARPRARDRGRVFIGPLNVDAAESTGTGSSTVPTPGIINAVVQAGADLRADATVDWVVWSRANASTKSVTSCWVDNAFDIQRRRGERATAKTTA